jgi:hypothetical protein
MVSLKKRSQTYQIVFMSGGERQGSSFGISDRREA